MEDPWPGVTVEVMAHQPIHRPREEDDGRAGNTHRAGKKCEERGANAPRDPFTRYGVYNRIDHRSQTEQRHRKTDDEAGVRSVRGNGGANHYPRVEGASFV